MKTFRSTLYFLFICGCVFSQEPQQSLPNLDYYIKLKSQADIEIDNWILNAPSDKTLEGKFLVINFWQTDCDVCDAGLKKIERLSEDFKECKNLYFINLAYEDPKKVLEYFKRKKLSTSLIVASDKRKITKLRSDGIKTIIYPQLILVNQEGTIVVIQMPAYIDKQFIQDMLDNKLESFDAFYRNH